MDQAPCSVNEETTRRIRYLGALTHATQAETVDPAVSECAPRSTDRPGTVFPQNQHLVDQWRLEVARRKGRHDQVNADEQIGDGKLLSPTHDPAPEGMPLMDRLRLRRWSYPPAYRRKPCHLAAR
jgi:hypothetical protein